MKKRRTESSGLEDAERSLHASFCAAANSISHLYTQAQTQNKISFQAGQRHSLDKLCEWIQKHHHQFGSFPATADIVDYLKTELDNISQNEMTLLQVQNGTSFPSTFSTDQTRFPPESHRKLLFSACTSHATS